MRFLYPLVATMVMTAPLYAQEQSAPEPAGQQQTTPEDDLDCALFTAYVLEAQGEKMDEQSRAGIISGVTYFIGRYEALRGSSNLKQAMFARLQSKSMDEFGALGEVCGGRMEILGERLQDTGDALVAYGKSKGEN